MSRGGTVLSELRGKIWPTVACVIVLLALTRVRVGAQPAPKPSPPPADTSVSVTLRVSDVARVLGTNSNPLIGYGLVVGLQGSGDSSGAVSQQMLARMLGALGMMMPPAAGNTGQTSFKTKNIAVVMVTADLPPVSRPGDTIDVTVSSLGDASSLTGGVLLLSLLKGANGQVYASAQGPVVVGGGDLSAAAQGQGQQGASAKPHLTTGQVFRGGLITREAVSTVATYQTGSPSR